MKFHPCFGVPLQKVLKLIVALDIIVSALPLIAVVMGIFFITNESFKSNLIPNPVITGLNVYLSTIVVFGVFLIIDIMLDIWLWMEVTDKNRQKCQLWFVIKFLLEICDAIGFIVEVSTGQHTEIYISLMIADFIFTAYYLLVLYAFIDELGTKVIPVVSFTAAEETPSEETKTSTAILIP